MMAPAQNDPPRAGTIWAIDLHESRPQPEPLIPVEFGQLGPASLDLLVGAASGSPTDEILHRFDAGSRCYAARVDGRLASYGWVSFREESVGELNLRVRLLPGEAYIWDCFTLPEYRRQGLYSALLGYILSHLEEGSVCRTWIGTDTDNIASQRGIARAGFRHVADLVLAPVRAMRLIWVQGMPGIPEPVVAEARRAFLDHSDAVWPRAAELLRKTGQPDAQPPDQITGPEPPSRPDEAASHTVPRS